MTRGERRDAIDAVRDAASRDRGLRVLTVLLLVAAVEVVVWAAVTVHAPNRPNVDPVLEDVGAGRDPLALRLWLGVQVAVVFALAAIVASRWLPPARDALAAMLGTPIDRRRPGPPGRFSARRWRPLVAPAAPHRDEWFAQDRVGDGRLGGALVVGSLAIGSVLVLVGLAVEVAGGGRPALLVAAGLEVAGSVLLGVGAALAVPVLIAIRRREVVCLRNVVTDLPSAPRPWPLLAVVMALPVPFALAVGFAAPVPAATCRIPDARCIELIVPADRDNPASGETMTVRYALYESGRPGARLLVIAVGGPGTSGLEHAEGWLEALGPRIRNAYDVAFFDQRGVGASGRRDCPDAAETWNRGPVAEWAAAREFVRDCLREAGVAPDHLPRYRTEQVVGDIEALRVHLGRERLTIYGESYGTELAQAYGIAHPDRVDALVLDGPVDLALDPRQFWLEAVRGFGAALDATFEDCEADPVCNEDLPDPTRTYHELIERLDKRPLTVEVNDAFGPTTVTITRETFEAAVGSAMYSPSGRSIVLRTLAEGDRDGWDYVARFAGESETLWYSRDLNTFVYYAVSCGDEPFTTRAGDGSEYTTGAERAAAQYIATAEEAGVRDEPLGSTYFAGLPCVHWPVEPDDGLPGLSGAPFPVLVLTATADPITPARGGQAIVARQPDGYLVETRGGGHVTFGIGDPCVDDVVTGLLVEGTRPEPLTVCEGYVTDGHLPLSPLDADELDDPLHAASTVEAELLAAPEFYWWDGSVDLELGCRFGGSARIDYDGGEYRITLNDCEWSSGLPLDGNGRLDPETGDLRLDLVGDGIEARYVSTLDEWSIDGTWGGDDVSIEG